MAGWWTLVRIVHVLGASIWLGSLVAFTFLVRPQAERTLSEGDAFDFLQRSGRPLGFFIAGVLVPVQLFSGLALLLRRGFNFATAGGSLYGRLIVAKILLFFLVVGVSAAHGAVSTRRQQGASRVLAYLALLGSFSLVVLGASLVP